MTTTTLAFDDSYPYINQCECGNEVIEGDGDHHAFTDFHGVDQYICYYCCVRGMLQLGDFRDK